MAVQDLMYKNRLLTGDRVASSLNTEDGVLAPKNVTSLLWLLLLCCGRGRVCPLGRVSHGLAAKTGAALTTGLRLAGALLSPWLR